mgnify:CR=1 FL=1|tara:strand:+ start:2136 stop:2588 length:453 start_codon:yes stop_codon:yes gene_type:complete
MSEYEYKRGYKNNYKKYLMDDGTYMTVKDIMDCTGLTSAGAHKRMQLSKNPNWVCLPRGHKDLEHGPGDEVDSNRDWDEEVKVHGGIPMNPSYLDGIVGGDLSFDRHGKPLSYSERRALAEHREKQRDEWRASNFDIKNIYIKEEEEDDS